jgi:hypothetical protein
MGEGNINVTVNSRKWPAGNGVLRRPLAPPSPTGRPHVPQVLANDLGNPWGFTAEELADRLGTTAHFHPESYRAEDANQVRGAKLGAISQSACGAAVADEWRQGRDI